MGRNAFIALLVVFLAAASSFAAGTARASGSSGFTAWAMSRSSECDSRWASIATIPAAGESASRPEGTQATSVSSSINDRASSPTKLSHKIIDSRDFVRHIGGDFDFLQLSTRKRNGAARGLNTLKSPADARLNVPHRIRRPLNSSIQQKNFFHSFGEVTRPRLKSFGRIHKSEHSFSRTATRPSYRAARPRIL